MIDFLRERQKMGQKKSGLGNNIYVVLKIFRLEYSLFMREMLKKSSQGPHIYSQFSTPLIHHYALDLSSESPWPPSLKPWRHLWTTIQEKAKLCEKRPRLIWVNVLCKSNLRSLVSKRNFFHRLFLKKEFFDTWRTF